MALMTYLLAPANLITIIGGMLTVVGIIAYLTGAANLSVPTLFYGFPIFLGGLALKTSELPPATLINAPGSLKKAKAEGPTELIKLLGDVTRWRYGQKVHLESSLQALKLWNEDSPPALTEIELLETQDGYGVRLRFNIAGVPLANWEEKKERLGRFFAQNLQAELNSLSKKELDLILLPNKNEKEKPNEHGIN